MLRGLNWPMIGSTDRYSWKNVRNLSVSLKAKQSLLTEQLSVYQEQLRSSEFSYMYRVAVEFTKYLKLEFLFLILYLTKVE
jgi:hypothetical protein